MSINAQILWPICTISALLQWRNNVHATTWMDLTNNIEWKKPKLTWYTNCMILFLLSGKTGKIVLEARITTVLRTAVSVSSSGSCMERSVSLGKSRWSVPLRFAHFSLCSEKCYMEKKKKADITKGFCLCCSTGTDILQAGLPETGLWVEISIQEIGQDLLLGSHHYVPGTGRKQALMAEKGRWNTVTRWAQLPIGELCNWTLKTSPSWCWLWSSPPPPHVVCPWRKNWPKWGHCCDPKWVTARSPRSQQPSQKMGL